MNKTDDWFRQASFNQFGLNKDTDENGEYDIYRIKLENYSKATNGCNHNKVRSMALNKIKEQGIDINLYQSYVLLIPKLGCNWSGLGTLGCQNSCTSWVQGVGWGLVYTHELGHNLGMHHASTDPENDDKINAEYGDKSCPMGASLGSGYFNAPHSHQMLWSTVDNGHLAWISKNKTQYTLPSYGPNRDQAMIYQFTVDKKYFLGFRERGYFDKIDLNYTKGVSLYAHPGGRTRYIKTIKPGETYSNHQFVIKSVSTATGSTDFEVSLCKDPLQIIHNKNYSHVKPGDSLELNFTLKILKGLLCAARKYLLTALSSELPAEISKEEVTLEPGTATNVTVKFTTALEAHQYELGLKAIQEGSSVTSTKTAFIVATKGAEDFAAKVFRRYYKGEWNKLPDFSTLYPEEKKIVEEFTLAEYKGTNEFALTFEGYLYLTPGEYTFQLSSNEGSRLHFAGQVLIDRDGLASGQPPSEASFTITEAFYYPIRLEYFKRRASDNLKFKMKKDSGSFAQINPSLLFHFTPLDLQK